MTFAEKVKAMPEADRIKFFRLIMRVAEEGRKANVPAEEWAAAYAGIWNEVEKQLKEQL